MATFHLQILAADKKFYEGDCQSVIVPALDGEMEILAHHEKMILATKEGELRFRRQESEPWNYVVVGIGFASIVDNHVTLLVDTAERPEDIDRLRAERALERAQEQLRQKQSIQEHQISQASLVRAVLRLKEAGKVDFMD
ncbi:MAG: ATP synthase F1 subunit epsilon [Candidatus Gastranaerophilales bacterium]|nr:ATP synthase F1 subunit epsilon [Candidatus Gastranaerophilales bacterium]